MSTKFFKDFFFYSIHFACSKWLQMATNGYIWNCIYCTSSLCYTNSQNRISPIVLFGTAFLVYVCIVFVYIACTSLYIKYTLLIGHKFFTVEYVKTGKIDYFGFSANTLSHKILCHLVK